jgi:hypothetical protein
MISRIRVQRNKDKLKKLKMGKEQEYRKNLISLNVLEEEKINATIKNRKLKNEKKKLINKACEESKLECTLNELEKNNKLEETKRIVEIEEELSKDKLKKKKK